MINFKSIQPALDISQKQKESLSEAFDRVLADPEAGFVQVLKDPQWLDEVQKSLSSLKPTDKIAVVGTGGSVLGSQAILDALMPQQNRVVFFSNTEEWCFNQNLAGLSPENVFWILVSKSGETFETQAFIERMMVWSKGAKRELKDRAVVITQFNQNEMHLWANELKVPTVAVPKNLSGRYSVISPVGLVPALAVGLKIQDFLTGAKNELREKDKIVNACHAFFQSFQREEWITIQFCYSLKLRRLGDWWVQLWSESLAKKEGRRVSTPMVSVGSVDQHSLLQQYMDGARDKFFVFLSYKSSNELEIEGNTFKFFKKLNKFSFKSLLQAQLQGTQNAFQQNNISFGSLEIEKLTEQGLGSYFLFWELVVATMAQELKINAYNQPGVELGKRLASDLLLNPKVEH